VITCPACSKQNQDHYRFCLGCGAELPRGTSGKGQKGQSGPAEFTDEETSVGGVRGSTPPATPVPPAMEQPQLRATDVGVPPGKCPECGYVNPPTNRFCASCGFRLSDAKKVAPKKPAMEEVVGAMLVALDPEGNEVARHPLPEGDSTIGRNTGGVFASDTFLSPDHASFTIKAGKVRVKDRGSLNGVFRKLLAEQRSVLHPGQRLRIGQELLQYDVLEPRDADGHGVTAMGSAIDGYIGRISLVIGRTTMQPGFPIPERGINMGRERGDVLFPEDGYVSGLHCHISYEDGDVWVTDLGSSNGTFVQLTEETELQNGDVLLMGQQLFRLTV
jgi:pSer/pThr/pTyr-binding forkhead associated (FHA) protein